MPDPGCIPGAALRIRSSKRRELLAGIVAVAAAIVMCPGAAADSNHPPAVELFLQRVTGLFSGISAAPLRTWSSGTEVFFESSGLRLPAGELSFAGRLAPDADGGFEGTLDQLTLTGRRGLVLPHPARLHGAPDGTLRVEGLEAAGPMGAIGATGSFGPDARLDVAVRLAGVDLYALGQLFTAQPIASGRLDAELTLAGRPDDAAVHLTGSLDPGGGLPPVEAVDLRGRLAAGALEIEVCDGRLGGSPFRVSGRVQHVVRAATDGRAELTLAGENLLLYRTDDALLRGDLDLHLDGPADRLRLSGGVVLREGRYEGRLPQLEAISGMLARTGGSERRLELFSLRAAPWGEMALDVGITASSALHITTAAARIGARPALRLTGSGRTPVLVGRVDFEPGVLYLPGGRLDVSGGVLRFQPPDPSRPRLEMVGSGRMQGYEITAVAEGPWDEPRVTLTSYPVLENEELLLLVLTGQNPRLPRAAESEKSNNMNVAVALGKDMLARIGGNGRASETTQSVVDRFNVEVGRNVTRTGDETVHVLFRVADNLLREPDTLYLSGERDVWGYFNGGVRLVFRLP